MTEALGAREITITRVFEAPREAVWKAWTEPEQLARWWGRRGWNTPLSSITMDVSPGGALRLTSVSEADGTEMSSIGTYREVVEPERLVFAETDESGCPKVQGAVATVTLTDLGDGRTEMVCHIALQTTVENRDRTAGGLTSAFERLSEHLA